MDRQIDRQLWTDRRTDNYGQIDGQTITDRQLWTDRRTDIYGQIDNYGQIDGQTIMDRQTDRQLRTDRLTDNYGQTIMDRQTNRQTDNDNHQTFMQQFPDTERNVMLHIPLSAATDFGGGIGDNTV